MKNLSDREDMTPTQVQVDARCSDKSCDSKGEYLLTGACYNCRANVIGRFTVGHEAKLNVLGPECPVCGCRRLHWEGLHSRGSTP